MFLYLAYPQFDGRGRCSYGRRVQTHLISSFTPLFIILHTTIIIPPKPTQLGSGPGPVVHTSFANSSRYFPSVPIDPSIPNIRVKPFLPLHRRKRGITFLKDDATDGDDEVTTMGKIIPIVDNMHLVERFCQTSGVTNVQLRMKNNDEEILPVIKRCQVICAKARVHLWINEYWKAIQAGCFGVHHGQED